MATLKVTVLGDASNLVRTFRTAATSTALFRRQVGGFSKGLASGTGAMSKFGGALALTSGGFLAGAGLVAGFKAVVGKAADFEQTMNVLQAVTHGTGAQMRQAGAVAQKLGGDITLPGTSAKDAAVGMTELAKGGLTMQQSMAAAKGTLQLAAAAQVDVGTAAVITANALNAFGLSGDKATSVADALANVANASTGSIEDFALGFQSSSAVAHQFGLSIEDTATALGVLANKGISGSDAGTSLRTMLTRLVPQTTKAKDEMAKLGIRFKDAKGNIIPFRDQIKQYHDALGRLTPAQRQQSIQTIFGSDAQRAANIIFGQGVVVFDKMHKAVSRQGGAAKLSAAQNKGYKGALDALKSALETVEIQLGTQLLPVLTRYLRAAAKWLGDTRNQKLIQQQFAAALKFVGSALRTLHGIVVGADNVFGSFANTVKVLVGAFIALKAVGVASSVSRTIQTMTGLATASGGASEKVKKVGKESEKAAAKTRSFRLSTRNLRGSLVRLTSTPYIITFALVAIGAAAIAKKIKDIQQRTIAAQEHKLAKGSKTEKSLVPSLVRQIGAQKARGAKTGDIAARLKEQLGGSLLADDLIATAFRQFGERNIAKRGAPDDRAFGKQVAVVAKKKAQKMAAVATDALKKNAPKLTAEQKNAIVERRNQFFDSLTDRRLNRIQDLDIGQQAGALDAIAGDIQARIGKTKDVTRKLNLEDKLLDVRRQSKDAREQVAQNFLDRLQFNVDKTAATKTFADDIATRQVLRAHLIARISADKGNIDLQRQLLSVNQELADIQKQQKEEAQANLLDRLQFGIEKADATKTLKDDIAPRIALRKSLIAALKTDKDNLDLQRQLLQVNVDIRDKQQEQREAVKAAKEKQRDAIRGRQFRTLGLTKEGDEIIPGIANLKKRAANLTKALRGVTGTFASKSKIRLKGIQKALVDAMLPGHNIPEVRAKIKELLDGISQELKDNKNSPTKGLRAVSTRALTEGLNLTKEQRRALRQRIAGAHLINRVTPDGGKLGSKGATIHVHHTTKLDGKVVSRSVTSHQTKANRRKPTQTRGQQTR